MNSVPSCSAGMFSKRAVRGGTYRLRMVEGSRQGDVAPQMKRARWIDGRLPRAEQRAVPIRRRTRTAAGSSGRCCAPRGASHTRARSPRERSTRGVGRFDHRARQCASALVGGEGRGVRRRAGCPVNGGEQLAGERAGDRHPGRRLCARRCRRPGRSGWPSEGAAVRPWCPAGVPSPPPTRRAGTRPPHRRLRTRPMPPARNASPTRSRTSARGSALSPGVLRLCSSFMLYLLLFPWAETPAVRARRAPHPVITTPRPPAAARQPGAVSFPSIPSSRSNLPSRFAPDASRRASPGAPPPGSTSANADHRPGDRRTSPASRRMRLRASTTTGTTTWRVSPQG